MTQTFSEAEFDGVTERSLNEVEVEKVSECSFTQVNLEAPVWSPEGYGKICSITLKPREHCEHHNPKFAWSDRDATAQDWYTENCFPSECLNSGEFEFGAKHNFIRNVGDGVPSREGFSKGRICSSNKSFLMDDPTFTPQRTSTYVILTPDISGVYQQWRWQDLGLAT